MPRAVGEPGLSRRRGASWALASLALAGLGGFGCGPPRLPERVEVLVRGHSEVRLEEDGSVLPAFLGWAGEPPLAICLGASESAARSWRGRLEVDGRWTSGELLPPALVAGRVQCFEAPTALLPEDGRAVEVCGRVRDEGSGETFRLPCRRVMRVADDGPLRRVYSEWSGLARGPRAEPLDEWLARVDGARATAEEQGAPCLSQREALTAVSFAITAGRFAEARRRLAALPSWLDQGAASYWGGLRDLEAARLARQDGRRLEQAWRLLASAQKLEERVASASALEVAREQAWVLSLVGALEEAETRLTEALDPCRSIACGPTAQRAAWGQLAWLRLLDPDASAEKLAAAGLELERSRPSGEAQDPLESANLELSLAYWALRRERDPAPGLAVARRALEPLPESERRHLLLAWATLIEGLATFRGGRAAEALRHCSRLLAEGAPPTLAGWAHSCAGRAHRLLGDGEAARKSLEQALLAHERAMGEPIGLALGPGQRADDFYQAARLAVEGGRAGAAWQLLERLDRLALEERSGPCEAGETPAQPAGGAGDRQRQLRQDLEALGSPAGRAERERREPLIRVLKEELQELARRRPRCDQETRAGATGISWGLKAFALPEEVLVLTRAPSGEVSLAHRAAVDRRELKDKIEALTRALDERRWDDEAWRRQAAPVAAALLPRGGDGPASERAEGEMPVSLYGVLQGIPLAALPLASGGWLADRATVVMHGAWPSRPVPQELSVRGEMARRAFLVDPESNLPGGRELSDFYARLFPSARVLLGRAAGRAALRGLGELDLLHLDVHGRYDSRFPELSTLELADGPVSGAELAELALPRQLVNLSGCGTGRWPVTADSGRFGLAGFFLARGVPWAIASSADLGDQAAVEFNRAFYAELARGQSVVESYGAAHRRLREAYPASAWGGLLLLRGFFPAGGQKGRQDTPWDPRRGVAPGSVGARKGADR